jgi:hypothetical protein
MARVQYGSVITEINGSIGGITFQPNSSAKIARVKPIRRRKNTTKQASRLNAFQLNIPDWSTLDQSDKDDWTAFAIAHDKTNKWGEVKTLTGFNWFQSINNYLNIVGETPISTVPVWTSPLAVSDYTVAAVYNDFSINWAGSFAHTTAYLLLFTSPLLRTVSLANRKVLRLTKIVSPGTDTSVDFLSEWQSVHGIAVPIAGSPSKKFIFTAVLSVHETKGISSAFNTNYGEYEPT